MRVFGSPHRYYQGPDVFDELGPIIAPFGPRPLIVVDALMLETLRGRLEATLGRASVTGIVKSFSGEITYAAIDDLIAELKGAAPTAAVGIGGGKSLDASKAVALKLSLPVVTVPTIASNDSPTSSLIAMYDASHSLISVDKLPRSPEAVVVDTAIIAKAPARLLRAGIGDAVAKKFEAEGCLRGTGKTPFGTRPLHTAMVIAEACYKTLRVHAVDALAAVEQQRVDDALEFVVEATILMSGLGFENGGLSLAHSMTRGLVKARGARDAIHGDQVAYGLLVQLAFENRPDAFLLDLLDFYRAVGLPFSLRGLGMDHPTHDEVVEIARLTMTAPHLGNVSPTATERRVAEAVDRVERLAV